MRDSIPGNGAIQERRELLNRLDIRHAIEFTSICPRDTMSTYVLVHGAWHGAWCWYKVASRLRRAGHTVIAPDLAGLGKDKTPIAEVSLERWTEDI
jgi:pimeloyl-ACP methyl ester carboxylesterase